MTMTEGRISKLEERIIENYPIHITERKQTEKKGTEPGGLAGL